MRIPRISSKFYLYHINFVIFFALAAVLFAPLAHASHKSGLGFTVSVGRTEPRFDDGIFRDGVSGNIFLKRLEPQFEPRPRRDVSLEASLNRIEPQFEPRPRSDVSLGISVNRIEPNIGDKSSISGGISFNTFQPDLGSNFLRGTSFSQRFSAPSGGGVSFRITPVFP